MKILGINTFHDAGAAIVIDGKVVAAVNEERLNRDKMYWGAPYRSINAVMKLAKLEPKDIDYITVAGITLMGGEYHDFNKVKFLKRVVDWISIFGIAELKIVNKLYRLIFRIFREEKELIAFLKSRGFNQKINFIEHHLSHAASAYYTSHFSFDEKVLIVTTDSSGDGLCATISIGRGGKIERKHETSFFHSPGVIYSYVTHNMGFIYGRHEGKVTGLAAYGDPQKTYHIFEKIMGYDLKKLEFRSALKSWGRPAARKLHLMCQGYKREDIAAGVQKRLEDVCVAIVKEACNRYGTKKVALAGGVFANVRVNQKISEINDVEDVYIHPHMGDGGVSTGSALYFWAEKNLLEGKEVRWQPLKHVYLGLSFSKEEIEKELKDHKIKYVESTEVEKDIAKLLADGKVVARFNSAVEYGPRALGNRSILYQPDDKTVNDWLNNRLARTEFMPFAPSVIFERAAKYFNNFNGGFSFSAEFMTITYNVTEECIKEAPAVAHVDNTARPHLVRKEINPSFYKIIEEYEKLTGRGIIINTSFNMHEEPIVCSPEDAIRCWKRGHLDVLAIGDFILFKE